MEDACLLAWPEVLKAGFDLELLSMLCDDFYEPQADDSNHLQVCEHWAYFSRFTESWPGE